MNNNTTILTDEDGNTRDFSFDFSYWSHDGYEVDE